MPSEKQYLERRENIASILQYLRVEGPKSRRQICDALGLSWGCVSDLVSILLLRNILFEEEVQGGKTKGRVPAILHLNKEILFLGVDININGLKGCICNLAGEKTVYFSSVLECDTKEQLIEKVCSFVDGIIQSNENICGIGFAMQGVFDQRRQAWKFPAPQPFFIDFSQDFEGRFALPVTVEHDPKCILYGCLDDTKGSKMIVRLDKGIGAAVYTGNGFMTNALLEIGYVAVNGQGERLQDVVSLNALRKVVDGWFDLEEPSAAVRQFFDKAGRYLGVTLGNICNLLSLDEIFVCGDMAAYYPLFSSALQQYYEQTVLPAQSAVITAVPITDAAYGAAKMAMDRFQY